MIYTRTWGYAGPNGEWTGLSGYLHRKEIDMAASSLFMLKERVNFTDFTSFTTPSEYKTYLYILPNYRM